MSIGNIGVNLITGENMAWLSRGDEPAILSQVWNNFDVELNSKLSLSVVQVKL